MEILQFLLSYFIKEYGGEALSEIFERLKDNSFDLLKTIKSIKPEQVMPIISDFINGKNKKPFEDNSKDFYDIKPIINIADEKIITALNTYFSN